MLQCLRYSPEAALPLAPELKRSAAATPPVAVRTLQASMVENPQSRATEKAQLLTRCRLTLDAIERAESSPVWAQFRATVEASASRLGDLRSIVRELLPIVAILPADIRADLARQLSSHGVDLAQERKQQADAVAKIRERGRIRSEAEYRRVQAYADALTRPEDEAEFITLGALLDTFMAGASAPERGAERDVRPGI
jgi:hypothetical protein